MRTLATIGIRHTRTLLSALLISAASIATARAQLAPNQIHIPPAPSGATSHSLSVINYDGSRMYGGAAYSVGNRPFLWTGGATSTDLGAHISPVTSLPFTFNGIGSIATNAISDDGLSIAGTSSSSGTPGRGWIWRSGTGYQDLGTPSGANGVSAFGLSRDGTTVVGLTSVTGSTGFRWRNGIFELLGVPTVSGETYTGTSALATNGNGDVIVGFASRSLPTTLTLPFIWRAGTGFEIIQTGLGNGSGQARALSNDGTIVAGTALFNTNNDRIFRRAADGSFVFVQPLTGDLWTEFRGMSADGSKIVGRSGNAGASTTWRAILWTATDGVRSINDIVAGLGISHPYTFTNTTGISGDGSTIIGLARNPTTNTNNIPFALRILQTIRISTLSQSLTQIQVPDAIMQNFTNTTYDTTVKTVLDGATLLTQQFDVIASAAPVQNALNAARDTLRAAAGLRRVTISGPVTESSETVVTNVTGPIETQIVETLPSQNFSIETQGPATIATGDRGICTNPGANGAFPTGCTQSGTPRTLASNEISDHTHTANFQRVTRVLTTTTDQVLEETYAVRGVLGSQVGAVHVLASALTLRAGERLVQRLLSESLHENQQGAAQASAPVKVAGDVWPAGAQSTFGTAFVEAYGVFGTRDGQTGLGVADADYEGDGVAAAAAWRPDPNLLIGVAVEYGERSGDMADALNPEHVDLDFVQGGAYAAWRHEWFQMTVAATYGDADLETRIEDGGSVNVARYDVSFWAAGVSASADLELGGGVVLSPEAGALWTGADVDRFAETGGGPMSLSSPGKSLDALKLWAGASLRGRYELETGSVFEPAAYVRYAERSGDFDGGARLALQALPGTLTDAAGPVSGSDAIEAGASATFYARDGVSVQVRYDGSFSGEATDHAIQAALTIRF